MLFDWATMPYFVLVTIFFFAPYFSNVVVGDPVQGQIMWAWIVGTTGVLVACLAPVVGAWVDASGRSKLALGAFSVLFAVSAPLLFFAEPSSPGQISWLLPVIAIASGSVRMCTVVNNAQMVHAAPRPSVGALSGYGMALGSLGGVLVLAAMLTFVIESGDTGSTIAGLDPLGGADPAAHLGERVTGPLSALWYAVFVLPVLIVLRDRPTGRTGLDALGHGLTQLRARLSILPRRRPLLTFLVSSMLYRDGIWAIYAFGGVYAAGVLHLSITQIGIFGILTIVFGAVGGILAARLHASQGARRTVQIGCWSLVAACVVLVTSDSERTLVFLPLPLGGAEAVFYLCGAVVGAASNLVQAASRSLLIEHVEDHEMAQGFGLYAFAGRATSYVGPLLVGVATHITASQQAGLFPIMLMLVLGIVGLGRLDPQARTPAG